MKNLKKSVVVLVSLLSFVLLATASTLKINSPIQLYQYQSSSKAESDIKNINNWVMVDDEGSNCGATGNLVCTYEFEGDINAFQHFLEQPTTTAALINDHAVSTKR